MKLRPVLFNDGVIRAWDMNDQFVVIEWATPGDNKIRAVKDVIALERELKSKGYEGWIMGSEREHKIMHEIIKKLGGNLYASDEGHYFFMKVVA